MQRTAHHTAHSVINPWDQPLGFPLGINPMPVGTYASAFARLAALVVRAKDKKQHRRHRAKEFVHVAPFAHSQEGGVEACCSGFDVTFRQFDHTLTHESLWGAIDKPGPRPENPVISVAQRLGWRPYGRRGPTCLVRFLIIGRRDRASRPSNYSGPQVGPVGPSGTTAAGRSRRK